MNIFERSHEIAKRFGKVTGDQILHVAGALVLSLSLTEEDPQDRYIAAELNRVFGIPWEDMGYEDPEEPAP